MSSSFSEEPIKKKPDQPPAEYEDEAPPELPRLGSLAQKARGKQLNQARWILIVLGCLYIIVNGVQMGMLRDAIRNEIQKQIRQNPGAIINQAAVQEFEDQAYQIGMIIGAIAILVGVAFVVFGIIIKMYPVAVTITSLVLYLITIVGAALLNPQTLIAGIIIKVIIVVCLIKAIQAALAYEKEEQLEPAT
jgi:hypothetical protein